MAERTGVMTLRVWVESHDDQGLRARIFKTTDIAFEKPTPDAASTIEDVCTIVKDWLEGFIAANAN